MFYLDYLFDGEDLQSVSYYINWVFYLVLYIIREKDVIEVLKYYDVLQDIFEVNIVKVEVLGCLYLVV